MAKPVGHVEEAEIGAGRGTIHRESNPSRVPLYTADQIRQAIERVREMGPVTVVIKPDATFGEIASAARDATLDALEAELLEDRE